MALSSLVPTSGLSPPPPQHSRPTPGSIFAPSRLTSVTSPQGVARTGAGRTGARPGWGPMEHPSVRRASPQKGGRCAQEVWMLRLIR